MYGYKCSGCGEICPEEEVDVKKFTDWVPYGDTHVPLDSYEHYCPSCGSEDIEEGYWDDEDEEFEEDDDE